MGIEKAARDAVHLMRYISRALWLLIDHCKDRSYIWISFNMAIVQLLYVGALDGHVLKLTSGGL